MAIKFLQKVIDEETGTIRFTLGDGRSIGVQPNAYPEDMRGRAMFHGFSQKIGDAASGYAKEKDYDGAYAAMLAVHEALEAGDWTRKGGGTGVRDLVQAIANITKQPLEKVQAKVDTLDEDQVKALGRRPDVKLEIGKIKLARLEALADKAESTVEDWFGDD